MQMPQVLILAQNDFHRRLMTDLVACNEMRVLSAGHTQRLEQVESGAFRPDVVVIDFSMNADEVKAAVGRLRALPVANRPRIVGVSAAANLSSGIEVEERLAWPLDIGDFARVVKGQAQAQLLAMES